jgi:hypothetical protein
MRKRRRAVAGLAHARSVGEVRHRDRAPNPFESWERYPADQAKENIEYQRLASLAAPAGETGVVFLVLAVVVGFLRAVARRTIRLLMR